MKNKDSQVSIQVLSVPGYEKVIEAKHAPSGLHAFVAIHSTRLGPSLGGIRMFPYASREEALQDALRLSKAMTLKSALAETGLGGGKSVLIGNPKTQKTKALLLAFAEVLNYLKGRYIAAEDVGMTAQDLLVVKEASPYVAALPIPGSSGDPSRFTAFGICRGIEAVCRYSFGSDSLKGRRIALQGLGAVGYKLAYFLFWKGAKLILSDLDSEKLENTAAEFGAEKVGPEAIIQVPCDILCPCAMGGVIYKDMIHKLKCKAIAGSANNQLQTEADGAALQENGILYAPDFVINAGGIINASSEFLPGGYLPEQAREKTDRIYDTLMEIFSRHDQTGKPTEDIAYQMAEEKLYAG